MKCHNDDERTGVSLLCGEAERGGIPLPGQKKAQGGNLISVYKYMKGRCKENGPKVF